MNEKEFSLGCDLVSERNELKARAEKAEALLAAACGTATSPTWPYVLEFARRMEKRLDANRRKGNREGWINDNVFYLARRIQVETSDLFSAMIANDAEEISNKAADIANFSMMVADWFTARAGLKE